MPKVFVETSIHIQRFLATGKEQDQFESQFATLSPNLYTSAYVWMEFQRTIVSDLAHIQQLILNHHSWGSILSHLLDGQRSFQPRSAVRCTKLLGLLHDQCAGDWNYAQYIVNGELNSGLETRFWTNVTPIPDPITCDLVVEGITSMPDGSFAVANSCRKATAACCLPNFLSEHHTKLRTIADYLAAHPQCIKQQERVEHHLAKVIGDPREVLGQSTCWPLGDVIILLQVPSDTLLWTLDSDFESLTAALGLRLYKENSA